MSSVSPIPFFHFFFRILCWVINVANRRCKCNRANHCVGNDLEASIFQSFDCRDPRIWIEFKNATSLFKYPASFHGNEKNKLTQRLVNLALLWSRGWTNLKPLSAVWNSVLTSRYRIVVLYIPLLWIVVTKWDYMA